MSDEASPHSLFAEITPRPGMGTLFIRLIGPSIGAREAPIIQAMTAPAIDGFGSTLKSVVLDLTAITYMNSAALGMLVDCRTRALKHAGKAKAILLNPSAEILSVLKMVKFEKLFAIAHNADELSAAMGPQ